MSTNEYALGKYYSDNLKIIAGKEIITHVNYFPLPINKNTKDCYSKENFNNVLKYISFGMSLPNYKSIYNNYEEFETIEGMSLPKFKFSQNNNLVLDKGFLILGNKIFKEGYEFKFPLDLENVKNVVLIDSNIEYLKYDIYNWDEMKDNDLNSFKDDLNLDEGFFEEDSDCESCNLIKTRSIYMPNMVDEFEDNTEYYVRTDRSEILSNRKYYNYPESEVNWFSGDANMNLTDTENYYDGFIIKLVKPKIPFGFITIEASRYDGENMLSIDTYGDLFNSNYVDTIFEFNEYNRLLKLYLKNTIDC